tara:strand:- start:3295 stop:4137 length:843 start_codon:yes stop_codon:yes gene_type:complete
MSKRLNNTKEYTINPSELSYKCDHCAHLKHNFGLEDRGISAGITGELDTIEKEYFLGSTKKISSKIPEGEVIDADHLNMSFQSKILMDNKGRSFRISGKGDALIKFKDNSHGIIDYKTSKFKDKKNGERYKFLDSGIKEYSLQLHCYDLLFSNLENEKTTVAKLIKKRFPKWGDDAVNKHTENRLKKISEISIKKVSMLGLVYVYPEKLVKGNSLTVNFSFSFEKVKYDPKHFKNFLTKYFDNLEKPYPPEIPEKCKDSNQRQHCFMHSFFYDEKKLKKK